MFDEALSRDPELCHRWVVLVEGEPKQLAAVKAEARRVGAKMTILLDVVHVIEYVWKAARALFGESTPEAEAWVSDRLLALLTGRSGGDVVKTIRWWASRRELDESALKRIDTACNYLADRTRTRLMHYAEARCDGLPIATGVIEGACRYLGEGPDGPHRRALVSLRRRGRPPPQGRTSLRRLRGLLAAPPRPRKGA
jgi:hypothetical protein